MTIDPVSGDALVAVSAAVAVVTGDAWLSALLVHRAGSAPEVEVGKKSAS